MTGVEAWERFAVLVTGRKSWVLLVVVIAAAVATMAFVGTGGSGGQAPDSLPASSDSARAERALSHFADGDTASAVLVVSRVDDTSLSTADLDSARAALSRMGTALGPGLVTAPDGKAALGQVAVPAGLNGFALSDRVRELRAAATAQAPADLRLQVTGGPAFGADIAESFSGANVLLLSVTALVVMVLLVVTYRSPVLWLLPLSVVALADRVAAAVGAGSAGTIGLSFDGSTAGITSVLVFGAGTNYALLLISRYRDELHATPDHRTALRIAVRKAGPTILASNITVVLALLTLLLAVLPNTRSLGAFAALGLLIAVAFALTVLPPALALCGRKVFWPFIPRPDNRDVARTGVWSAVALRVVRRPRFVAATALILLAACAALLTGTHIGLNQAEQFRVQAESVDGLNTLAAHFPSGSSDPALVVADSKADVAVQAALQATDGVVNASSSGTAGGLTRWTVVLDSAPGSARAFHTIEQLRTALAPIPGADALVGGSDAKALDTRNASRRDQALVLPLILGVVLTVLLVLLRALPAALLLVGVTTLSALASLGLGSWLSAHVFGYPALDTNVPLFALLFLVALGVDYTIFLVARAKEEAADHGSTDGMIRAVASTGSVITSAGIVLAAVFCVLGVLPLITLTQLGIVVGIGILLDTFLTRTVIIPALYAVIGPRIWWPNHLANRPDEFAPSAAAPTHR